MVPWRINLYPKRFSDLNFMDISEQTVFAVLLILSCFEIDLNSVRKFVTQQSRRLNYLIIMPAYVKCSVLIYLSNIVKQWRGLQI